jgi:hypothetical protein
MEYFCGRIPYMAGDWVKKSPIFFSSRYFKFQDFLSQGALKSNPIFHYSNINEAYENVSMPSQP